MLKIVKHFDTFCILGLLLLIVVYVCFSHINFIGLRWNNPLIIYFAEHLNQYLMYITFAACLKCLLLSNYLHICSTDGLIYNSIIL
jgi:hypothetical protein